MVVIGIAQIRNVVYAVLLKSGLMFVCVSEMRRLLP